MINLPRHSFLFVVLLCPLFLFGQAKIATNHVGYEIGMNKKAVLVSDGKKHVGSFQLVNVSDGKAVLEGIPFYNGPVNKWKNWTFWTLDFSSYNTPGSYYMQAQVDGKYIISYPFIIGKQVLEQTTLSDVIYYFKGQRCSGLLDAADHHLPMPGKEGHFVDLHGGWYDATGDYGKHLSHLSFSSYFNPQQVSLTVWTLLKTYEELSKKTGNSFRQYKRRVLDEAMFGADYLVRLQQPNGSFFRSVSAPGPAKLAKDRVVGAESKGYRIKQSKDQSWGGGSIENNWKSYQVSFRSGGGLSIAALAMAAAYDTSGDFSNADYLKAAENAFAFLNKNNASMTNDGKENIVDDYCALQAATELFKTTKKPVYKEAADRRAESLMNRLASWKEYVDYWRADEKDRPFFHPSDAGLPLISLVTYYEVADKSARAKIKQVMRRSINFEMTITHEVNNPFGYSRQLVQDTSEKRWSSFFFPQGSEASPWWQGENARLGSMAAAARKIAPLFSGDKKLYDSLQNFAQDQLNWILGLNPFDACMLQGTGYNNPAYNFFGTFEYTNAPGGIVNGITSGLNDENDIDLNVPYSITGKDYDWRWAEQWLPHAAWYMYAVALGN
ncbi:glycoside hydrolase family 9 protein [Danxiaibacter flavus]|uniref:Glycoside hydrolase family 9 protein n=1 Tax=Danxiaibacter flavus TaxID=3049108 RepID=A0ABV3ZHV8_9BACT|nr:glycoside hydrolase family 9 protein [Chitinophagaceae bacterium DXS]